MPRRLLPFAAILAVMPFAASAEPSKCEFAATLMGWVALDVHTGSDIDDSLQYVDSWTEDPIWRSFLRQQVGYVHKIIPAPMTVMPIGDYTDMIEEYVFKDCLARGLD
jgi:hypothetical protein